MGLAEKRRIKEFVEQTLPAVNKEFHQATGLDLPIEFDPACLSGISDAGQLNETLDWITGSTNGGEFWSEPIAAWKEVAADDLGRSMIRERVKSWRLSCDPGTPTGVVLKDGVLLHSANFTQSSTTPARMWKGDFLAHLQRELAGGGLTLAERRHIRQIGGEVAPRYQAEIEAVVGGPVPVAVIDDFAKMPSAEARETSLDWLRGWINGGEFWGELVAGIKGVCVDQMGRDAIREAVRRIEVRWEPGRAADLVLKDGTLTYYYNWVDSPGASRLWSADIQARLEGML